MRVLNLDYYAQENADIILEAAERGDMRTLTRFVEKDRTFMNSYANALTRAVTANPADDNYLPTLNRLLTQPEVINPAKERGDREAVAAAFSCIAAYWPKTPMKIMRMLTRTFNRDTATKEKALRDVFAATAPEPHNARARTRAARLLKLPCPR